MIWLLLAALLLASCSRESPQIAYDRIWKDLRAGRLIAARAEVEREGPRWRETAGEWSWKFRLLESEVLLAQAEPVKALALLETKSAAPTAQLEARRLADLSDAFLKLDRIDDARRTLAIASQRASLGGWPDLQMHCALIESAFLVRMQQYARADEVGTALLKRADELKNRYYSAGARINLSMVALRQRRFDDAVALAERALEEAKSIGALRYAAIAALNLAGAYGELGDFDRAKQMQQYGAGTLELTGDQRALQASLGELANILVREGNPTAAVALYERAFHIAQQRGLGSFAQRWARNLTFSLTLPQLAKWNEAQRWNEVSRRLVESAEPRASLYLELNEGIIAAGRNDYVSAKQQLSGVLAKAGDDSALAWLAEAALAQVAYAVGDVAESNRRYSAALDLVDRAIGQLRQSQLRITLRARLINMYQDYVDALIEQGKVDRALEVAESSRAQLLAQKLGKKIAARTRLNAREFVAKARACNCTLLSYWLAPKRSFVWIVRPSGIKHELLAPLEEIERMATGYRRALLDGLSDPLERPVSSELSAALIQPVQRHLRVGTQVVVVPDGPLHSINLEALPVGSANRHYWIEDVSLAVAPSLLLLEVRSLGALRSALLVGAPTFASREFPTLRYASEELHAIRSRLGRVPAKLYEGPEATPKSYLAEASRLPSLIHFAAHADVRYENPFDSAIILSGSGGQERLSGRDIAAQPLQAELVTVAACKSAGTRNFAGEGLTGLAWAFLQSGARRVVAGSWDVSDHSSKAMMDGLYKGLSAGRSPIESLREAKLALLKSGQSVRHPFYWAPLQLYVRVIARAN